MFCSYTGGTLLNACTQIMTLLAFHISSPAKDYWEHKTFPHCTFATNRQDFKLLGIIWTNHYCFTLVAVSKKAIKNTCALLENGVVFKMNLILVWLHALNHTMTVWYKYSTWNFKPVIQNKSNKDGEEPPKGGLWSLFLCTGMSKNKRLCLLS